MARVGGRAGLVACALVAALVSDAAPARSDDAARVHGSPIGVDYLRVLGSGATKTLAPSSGLIGALVAIPKSRRAEDLGLEQVAPGIGRLRGSAARIGAFADAHPDLDIEIAPPLHPLMDRAGDWTLANTARIVRGATGKGVMVGVADTGLDVKHPEMRDAAGKSRVKWLLDLSLPPGGFHRELEEKFGIKDDAGQVRLGRVFDKDELDGLIERVDLGICNEKLGQKCLPTDEVGHGTHVTGIASASGIGTKYGGVAPSADIVFVRVTRGPSDGIENDDLVRAVDFMMDRADADKQPIVVNLSLGSDFGPHDGSFLWEQAIASKVGPDHPGHIVVAAAGNSGSIAETPIHQSVRVTSGSKMRVPIRTRGADSGSVQVWVTLRKGADLKIGLDGPDGEWIAPVESGAQRGRRTSDYDAGVIYGSGIAASPIPSGSRGAVVVWQGKWPTGTYFITLEGTGMAELYVQGLGDASLGGSRPAAFASAVREGTINLPATHPAIIGVGCTVNRVRWTSIGGADMSLKVPLLDAEGGLPISLAITPQAPVTQTSRDMIDGEVCWFSSSGPTATGVPKPEIAAPGALVVSAMSRQAEPGRPGSVFTSGTCPAPKGGGIDRRCLQVDENHAIAVGTSMSSPAVAGVVAMLLQADPTLTQDKVLALLQAGAHRYRALGPFDDHAGPGEVDAMGSLDALDQMRDPKLYLPALERSWLTVSSDYVPADGSTPITAIVELRTADGAHRADFFDQARLEPTIAIDSERMPPPPLVRRGPGVFVYEWSPPPGRGGSRATFGVNFDGKPIVGSRVLVIAPDRWTALYPSTASGSSCATTPVRPGVGAAGAFALLALALAARRRRQ